MYALTVCVLDTILWQIAASKCQRSLMRMDVIDKLGSNLTEPGILLDVTRSIGTFFVILTRGGEGRGQGSGRISTRYK